MDFPWFLSHEIEGESAQVGKFIIAGVVAGYVAVKRSARFCDHSAEQGKQVTRGILPVKDEERLRGHSTTR